MYDDDLDDDLTSPPMQRQRQRQPNVRHSIAIKHAHRIKTDDEEENQPLRRQSSRPLGACPMIVSSATVCIDHRANRLTSQDSYH